VIHKFGKKEFYGTAVLGEKGQIVVPAEARSMIGMKKGEKLLVFGMNREVLFLVRATNLEKLISNLSTHLKGAKEILKKTKK